MKEFFYQFKNGTGHSVNALQLTNTFSVTDLIVVYYNRFAPTFKFKNKSEKHNFFELYYIAEGDMTITLDGTPHPASAGDFFLLPPMLPHCMEPYKTYSTGIAISFAAENLPEDHVIHGKLDETGKYLIPLILNTYARNCEQSEFRPALFSQSETSTQKNDFAFKQLLGNLIECLLITILQKEELRKTKQVISPAEKNTLAQGIRLEIQKNYTKNLSLQDLAEKIGYSVPHICRVFKQAYNDTITNYTAKLKIEHALKLIESAKQSLKDISDYLGFDSISYFNKTFKKYTGMTPGAYKKFSQQNHLLDTYYLLNQSNL